MLETENSMGSRPFAEATLAEHREYRLNYGDTPLAGALNEFFQVPNSELASISQLYSYYDVPMFHRAIRACFPDWKLVGERGGSGFGKLPNTPTFTRFKMAPGCSRKHLIDGTLCYRLPNGNHRVIWCDLVESIPRRFSVVLFAHLDEMAELEMIDKHIRDWLRRHKHYLQGQAIRADATLLPRKRRHTWDDVMLEPDIREELRRQTVGFFAHRRLFRKNRIPQRRGLLLYGPPGNGKTMIGKILADHGGWTFIYATAGDIGDPDQIRACFSLARRLRPTILFFEDLDFFASCREENPRGTTLGEMLAQMDGMEKNDGIIVIGTTNDLDAIEPALKDRPSRFDAVLHIAAPNEERRRDILAHYLGRRGVEDALIAFAAHHACGFSAAQLKELAMQTMQQAILSGRVNDEGFAQPTRDDLDLALSRMSGRAKKPLGFQVAVI